jgi:uncharacterized membrane protein
MKTATSLRAFSTSKQLALTALFAALCLVGTLVIVIPLPMGFFNVGDVFVLLAGWFLGPLYGSVAAGMGSALADIIAGYGIYAPFTFVIKALDALTAYLVWRFLKIWIRKARFDCLPRFLSATVGEMLMIVGYLLTETLLYGFPTAVGTLLGNVLQGGCCPFIATMVCSIVYPSKDVARLFPHLKMEE